MRNSGNSSERVSVQIPQLTDNHIHTFIIITLTLPLKKLCVCLKKIYICESFSNNPLNKISTAYIKFTHPQPILCVQYMTFFF